MIHFPHSRPRLHLLSLALGLRWLLLLGLLLSCLLSLKGSLLLLNGQNWHRWRLLLAHLRLDSLRSGAPNSTLLLHRNSNTHSQSHLWNLALTDSWTLYLS